jgi:hypothetical protein
LGHHASATLPHANRNRLYFVTPHQNPQSRADYGAEDVEHYFNYMGCLAVEGTYDRMEEMMSSGEAKTGGGL